MKAIIWIALVSLAVLSCTPDRVPEPACGSAAKVDAALYAATLTNNYIISSASISGNCLKIKFGSSGCNASTWVGELVDAGEIAKTFPPSRNIKFKLTNNELCAAVFSKTFEYDISGLKVEGSNKVRLLLADYNGELVYEY